MEITYQHLTQQQIGPELFSGFDRWQNVTRCWRKENGSWVLRDISFIDDWNEEEYTFLYDCLKNTLNTGGDVIAALEGNRLLGFASVENQPFPIISAFDGIVRLAKPYYAYGNVIVVRHYNGLETVYSHNSKNLVKPGDYVKAGQPIALTGRTGRATTEHLHFEVRVNGQHFNPNLVFDLQERKLNNQCLVFTQKGGKIAVKPVELMPHQFAGDYSYSPASCKNKEQIESKKETL